MPSWEHTLATAPTDPRSRELWLQHGAGFILFQDIREYAITRLDPSLDEPARAAAIKGINDAVYGLMMVIDGVSGRLGDGTRTLELDVTAKRRRRHVYGLPLLAERRLRRGSSRQVIDARQLWLKAAQIIDAWLFPKARSPVTGTAP
jgi:hypothetical protein